MQKFFYESDPYNRLVVGSKKTNVVKFRRVLDGYFKVSEGNSLAYHVKIPHSPESVIPHQIKLKGSWSLDKNHNLVFTIDKVSRYSPKEELTIRGDIVGISKNSLLFSVTTLKENGNYSTYLLELQGSWQVDSCNRINFKVKRQDRNPDILVFEVAWELNKRNEIVYKYEKTDLIKKSKSIRMIALKGFWDLGDNLRISYVLDKNTDSKLDFYVSSGALNAGYIKYELGIGVRHKKRPQKRVIFIPGKWKINRNSGLFFEAEYCKRRIQSMALGATARITDRGEIVFNLKNNLDEDIGMQLKISRKLLKGDGEVFFKALKEEEEIAVVAGAGFNW